MKMEDLHDELYYEFESKCFGDDVLISGFVEGDYDNFEEYMHNRGIDSDYYCDYEHEYCEAKVEKFIEYCANRKFGK